MLDLKEILYTFEAAVLAITLHRLIQPGMIFSFWGTYLAKRQWDWPEWVRNPLGECFTCFSGQVGLWSGIALEAYEASTMVVIFEPTVHPAAAALVRVVFHTVFTIYFADILKWSR
jgi:hypothetical protein